MEKQTTTQESKEQQMPASRLPTTVDDIPEEVLRLMFRRLNSHVSFVRAAAVCTRWRRIASTRGVFILNHDWDDNLFSTNMGHYHVADDPPRSLQGRQLPCRGVVFVPASPSIDARHFALDFLPSGPGGRPWELVDGYASLLLLASHRRRGLFPDLVVCEPISRRYFRVKPPMDETMKYCHCLGVFVNHGRHGYRIAGTPEFSLTCVLYERSPAGMADDGTSVVTARVYIHQPRPSCRRWNHGWSTRRQAASGGIHLHGVAVESAHYAGRSKGFILFGIEDDGTVLAVEEGTGVFSHFSPPQHVRGSHHRSSFRFIDDDGAENNSLVRVVSLVGGELRVFLMKLEHNNGGGISIDLVPDVRSLNLREATRGLRGYKESFSQTAKIVTAGKGYVVLTPAEEKWLFSIELATMETERQHIRNRLAGAGEVYPYELRLRPTVRACVPL